MTSIAMCALAFVAGLLVGSGGGAILRMPLRVTADVQILDVYPDPKARLKDDLCIRVRCSDGVERTFYGDCTVWHDTETGTRAGTLLELRLCDVATKWQRDHS